MILMCGLCCLAGGFFMWVDRMGFESPVPAAMVTLIGLAQMLFWACGGVAA